MSVVSNRALLRENLLVGVLVTEKGYEMKSKSLPKALYLLRS